MPTTINFIFGQQFQFYYYSISLQKSSIFQTMSCEYFLLVVRQQNFFLSNSRAQDSLLNEDCIYFLLKRCYNIIKMLQTYKRGGKESNFQEKHSAITKVINSRYEVRDTYLGEGSFGQVFVGWDRVNFEILAIKIFTKTKLLQKINQSQSKSRTKSFYIKSLQDQALLLEKLNHPNILRFNGYSETTTTLYYFLEYCNQGTLQDLIQRSGKLSIEIAIPLMKQVLSSVIYLHRRQICHRDIKPQNILLHDGQAKLGDFGFAVCIANKQGITSAFNVGTQQFIAPEIISEKRFGLKSDVWSLGVTFFRMIYGTNPWDFCSDEKQWLKRIKNVPIVPCGMAPFWLITAINRMLTFSDDFRPSAAELEHFFEYY